jgi:hypothetical protein
MRIRSNPSIGASALAVSEDRAGASADRAIAGKRQGGPKGVRGKNPLSAVNADSRLLVCRIEGADPAAREAPYGEFGVKVAFQSKKNCNRGYNNTDLSGRQ